MNISQICQKPFVGHKNFVGDNKRNDDDKKQIIN